MTEQRPNPEILLQRAVQEERYGKRGRLKIYLGAAPGVGKTYAMLKEAQQERANGLDVVIGIIESHGRLEIESLLNNFDLLPKQKITYRNINLSEFDIDAALKRHPGLILMDEMAHTNAPGTRHTKRWRDIKELLDRGINVNTTLNIQHIESLKDDVSQIIQAPIYETVPDSMLDMADTIELIDIPPEDLIKRLHEGKVYFPAQSEIAAEHFFRKGNLIALRELALRFTAKFVGTQVFLYRQDKNIKHIWPTNEKILVCVGPKPDSLKLIRTARRIATSLQADWIAVYVDTPQIQSSEIDRNNAINHLHLADQLGAEIRVLTGFDIAKELMNFATEQNITQIMIWKHRKNRWRDLFSKNIVDEIVKTSGEIDVYIISSEKNEVISKKPPGLKNTTSWKVYGISLAIVSVATFINYTLYPFLNSSSLIMVYLLGVTVISLLGKTGPAILGSILSVILYDLFFVPPFYKFSISNIEYVVTLAVMLLVTRVISHLTILTRRQMELAQSSEHQTSALYNLSRQLANTRGVDKLLDIGVKYVSKIFESQVTALLPENNHLVIHGKNNPEELLNDKESSVAQWVYDLGQMAGLGTDTLPLSNALYVPLQGLQRVLGVLRIRPTHIERLLAPDQMRLLEACSNHIALALEVDRIHEQTKKIELQEEIDRVRNSLLQTVSHDLRTPLVAVMESARELMEVKGQLDQSKAINYGKAIYFEADQLNRLISNLLQIAYLETDSVKLDKKSSSLKELINHVIEMSTKKLEGRIIHANIPENLPMIPIDVTLIEDVFTNLIDNAIKFAPLESSKEIYVVVEVENNKVTVRVEDQGPGIVNDEVNKLFEKFYRGRMLTTEKGLGLGLAICQKIIKAHGGDIWADNRSEGGAVFQFTLPLSDPSM